MDKAVGVKDFIVGFQGFFSVADTGLKVRRDFLQKRCLVLVAVWVL